MDGELDKIIRKITELYQFEEGDYPETKNLTDEQKRFFGIRHLALHFSKTAGKIAATSEDIDHGGIVDTKNLKTDVAKSFINTLRLAELVGMTEQDLVDFVDNKYAKK